MAGCQLTTLLKNLRHDPTELAADTAKGVPVPMVSFLPLLEAGVTHLSQLLEPDGQHLVAASRLREHLRRHRITVANMAGLREALNSLTICLNAPEGQRAPSGLRVGSADLSKQRRKVQATHLLAGLRGGSLLQTGSYADGQRLLHTYSRPEAPPPAERGMRVDPPVQARGEGGAHSEEGQHRRCTAPALKRDPARTILEDVSGWEAYLLKFQQQYHGKGKRGKELRQRYQACPPPLPPPARDRRGRPVQPALTEQLHLWMCRRCEDPEVVLHIYRGADVPVRIVGEASSTQFIGNGKKRKKAGQQDQWVVEWAPTIIWRRHVPLYAALGYTPAEKPRPCYRWGRGPGRDTDTSLCIVHWHASNESKATFPSRIDNAEELIEDYRQRRAAADGVDPVALQRARREQRSAREHLEEQGLLAPPRFQWQVTRPDALSLITFNADPAHPELDIIPPASGPGTYLVRMGAAGDASTPLPVAHVHDPDGRWVGTLTCERLVHLRDRFEQAHASRPQLFADLAAGPFEEELAGLLRRWQAATRKLTDTKLQQLHSAPPLRAGGSNPGSHHNGHRVVHLAPQRPPLHESLLQPTPTGPTVWREHRRVRPPLDGCLLRLPPTDPRGAGKGCAVGACQCQGGGQAHPRVDNPPPPGHNRPA